MERRIERHRALSLPTHSLSGASKYYYAPVYQGILVGRRKGNEDNGPDRRRPYAMKVARAVTTGGMERRVAGYRALSLPTGQTAKRPGLAKRSYGEFQRSGFQPTGNSSPDSKLCPMGQSVVVDVEKIRRPYRCSFCCVSCNKDGTDLPDRPRTH